MKAAAEKAARFRALHERPGAFIIPNPWDAGTARLLASLGFEALATTSLGLANSLGRVDGTNTVSRAEVIENCRAIAAATDLPVNADLENGYADEPRAAAEIIRLAAAAGISGGSIEDATGDPARPIYDFDLAVERVHAAVEVARALPVPFMLTARAENLLHGARSRRHHPPPAGLRAGGRRRALRPRRPRPAPPSGRWSPRSASRSTW